MAQSAQKDNYMDAHTSYDPHAAHLAENEVITGAWTFEQMLYASVGFVSNNTGEIIARLDRFVTGGVGALGIGSLLDFRVENGAGSLQSVGQMGAFLGGAADNGNGFAILPSGTIRMFITTGNGLVGIGNNNTAPSAQLDVEIAGAAIIGQIIKGANAQSASLQEWQNNADDLLAAIDPSGNITSHTGYLAGKDGITAPGGTVGLFKIYVDTSDGDLKVVFGDGTVKTIATDT